MGWDSIKKGNIAIFQQLDGYFIGKIIEIECDLITVSRPLEMFLDIENMEQVRSETIIQTDSPCVVFNSLPFTTKEDCIVVNFNQCLKIIPPDEEIIKLYNKIQEDITKKIASGNKAHISKMN